jgi:two-component system chemotaxis response regulator CheY
MKLMIVDKQPHTREMVRNFLNLPGITVCECASGDEALARAREFKPDWITMDMSQIGNDSFQSADALREAHPSAQVIIMTGYNETNFHKLYHSVGRSALLEKKTVFNGTNSSRPAQRPESRTKLKRRDPSAEEATFAGLSFASGAA